MRQQYLDQSRNVEQFYKELDSDAVKFNTISTYFGMDLFSDID